MGFLRDVLCLEGGKFTPSERSLLGKFLILQGVLYALHGLSHLFVPNLWTSPIPIVPGFENRDAEGWFRAFGFWVFYIGVFYIFCGLRDSEHFALASTFTRPAFVSTLFMGYLGIATGHIPLILSLYYGIVDPLFAALTFVVYKRWGHDEGSGGYLQDILCLPGGKYTPQKRSILGWMSIVSGLIAAVLGLMDMLRPRPAVYGTGDEAEGWFRAVNFLLFYLGLLYLLAGLADSTHTILQGIFITILFVPAVFMGFIGFGGWVPNTFPDSKPIRTSVISAITSLITYAVYLACHEDKPAEQGLVEEEIEQS